MFKTRCVFPVLTVFCCLFLAPFAARAGEKTLTVGYFPNITHAHALVSQNMAAEGVDWFGQRLPGVSLRWQSFNAGPSAMESLFAKAIDVTYVGPNPVLNAFVRSKGGVRVVAGAVRGGAGLVVPKGSSLREPADFKGKRIATPQLGNTQDVACRYWLTQAGLRVGLTGGDAIIIPTPNASLLAVFLGGGVDAAWSVEPWVSRLELEGEGRLVYAEPPESSLTTVLAVGDAIQRDDPELVGRFVQAHRELTAWILDNPDEAKRRVTNELSRQMRREFPAALVERAWPRLIFDNAVTAEEFAFSLKAAQASGFLKGEHDLDGLVFRHGQ